MFGRYASKVIATLISALLLSGCMQSDAAIESSLRSPAYRHEFKTLFVIANISGSLTNNDGDNLNRFENLLGRALNQCGIATRVFVRDPNPSLSLNDDPVTTIKRKLAEFRPEAVLLINWKEHRSDNRGWNRTTYLLALQDTATHAIVWKADAYVTTHYHPAEIFTGAIIEGMRKDGVISPSCLAPPYDHSLFSHG